MNADKENLYNLKDRYTLRLKNGKWTRLFGWDAKLKENEHGTFIFIPHVDAETFELSRYD